MAPLDRAVGSPPPRVRYELVAHACLLFEFAGFKVLTDPWLFGPCYYGSWWHYPKPSLAPETLQDVDLIVISHMHADHFHPPTLKRLPKHVPVWIPKLFFTEFRDRLRELGFRDVIEAQSGRRYALPQGIRITSYSYRADDSAFVFEYGGRSWIHLNDCLLSGRTLARLRERHAPVHTMFKIFVNAEAYPACYDSEEPDELRNWSPDSILDSFLETGELLQPEYAVPYGGFVRSFHPEARPVNPTVARADRVLERAVETGRIRDRVRILLPGDAWSSESGFALRARDPESEARCLAEREDEVRADVQRICEDEKPAPEIFPLFESYFTEYLTRLPGVLRRKLDLRILFSTTDTNESCLLDLRRQRASVSRGSEPPEVHVQLSSALLESALTERSWLFTLGSYRARIQLRAGARSQEVLFWMSVFLFDASYFSFERFPVARMLSVLWARRVEFSEYAAHFVTGRFVSRHLEQKFEQVTGATEPRGDESRPAEPAGRPPAPAHRARWWPTPTGLDAQESWKES